MGKVQFAENAMALVDIPKNKGGRPRIHSIAECMPKRHFATGSRTNLAICGNKLAHVFCTQIPDAVNCSKCLRLMPYYLED